MNMCFRLTDLNRLHNPHLLPPYHPPLPSSQICYIHHCFTPLRPLHITLLPLLTHHSLLTCNSPTFYLPHHHMYAYLTILLQVQIEDRFPLVSNMTPLLVLGQPVVPLLLLLILPALKLLQVLLLLSILCLWQILPLLFWLVTSSNYNVIKSQTFLY